jgi:hypothetical protein
LLVAGFVATKTKEQTKEKNRFSQLIQEAIMKTKYFQYMAVLPTLTLLVPLAALARENQHSVDISDAVQIGGTQLTPGTYKVEWQGTGPAVQVSFERHGETLVTVPATLKTNDHQVTQDAIETRGSSADKRVLEEIDFGRQKEALVFDQNPGGI